PVVLSFFSSSATPHPEKVARFKKIVTYEHDALQQPETTSSCASQAPHFMRLPRESACANWKVFGNDVWFSTAYREGRKYFFKSPKFVALLYIRRETFMSELNGTVAVV